MGILKSPNSFKGKVLSEIGACEKGLRLFPNSMPWAGLHVLMGLQAGPQGQTASLGALRSGRANGCPSLLDKAAA